MFFHGLSYLTIVWTIYQNYHSTNIDGHIVCGFVGYSWTIFSQDKSWSAHNTVFSLHTLHDDAHNQNYLKIFQGSVSSLLFWRPGNLLILANFFSSNFAILATFFCFFKMA